jgi:4-hydroxyphenylpyruvate dioxygenase
MSTSSVPNSAATGQLKRDPLRLIDVDHVKFLVGNAKQAAYFYAQSFGFEIEQISDLTTGSRDEAAYLLTQGNIRFLISTGLTPDHPANQEVALYGDGIQDIAFTVDDAEADYREALKRVAQ